MRYAAARLLVLLLIVTQVALGRAAGGSGDVLCLGHAGGGTEEPAGSCCHDHGPPIVPVEPHEDDGCPCIDIPIAIGAARIDPSSSDDAGVRAAVTLAPIPLPLVLTPAEPARPIAPIGEPPGPPPGIRTTRLLI